MRTVVITRPGGPEVLNLVERPSPDCGPDQVRVDVVTTALNRADLLQRLGRYPAPRDAPSDVPGLEFAGIVADRGERVRRWKVGDRVMGLLGGGGYAEQVVVHERLCLAVPAQLGWDDAAAVPEAYLTAFDALVRQGELCRGQVALVHAAASGVGTAALQVARAVGASSIGLTRSPGKIQSLERLGLGPALHAGGADLVEAILDMAHEGVDCVLDPVGGSAWDLNVSVLRDGGSWILIGVLGGSRCEISLTDLLRKRLRLHGSMLRTRSREEKISLVEDFEQRMLPLLASGTLRPVVDRSFPIERVAQAHAWMQTNENVGKIVLRLRPAPRTEQ